MSRVSRYKKKQLKTKSWSAALYIRLSQEDSDNGLDKLESNSITSQRTLLEEFAQDHQDLKIYDTYIDDGYTGTDFNRPGFQRMLQDIRNGVVNCVIVKDLSRLGRNYIEVGNYIEQVFPLFNIRFIAINDMIDSFQNPTSSNTILVPFKNLINDEYARDTSIKIRSALYSKRKKGEFIGAFAAYGYLKNPANKHQLIIDEPAAKVVRNIFHWYVDEGLGKIAICHRLNELGVVNPTGHKRMELGQKYQNGGVVDKSYTWTPSSIHNILSNEVYIGNTVQGKRRTKSYKLHQVEQVGKEEWVRVEHTHEGIIEKALFEKAQNLNKRDTKASQKTSRRSIWAGMLKCADCHRAMNKKSSTNQAGKKYEYYICSTYRKKSHQLCTKHTIKISELEEAVLQAINWNVKRCVDADKITVGADDSVRFSQENTLLYLRGQSRPPLESGQIVLDIITQKQNQISKLTSYKRSLYEDWKNGDITREEFQDYKNQYQHEIQTLEQNINSLQHEENKNTIKKQKQNQFLAEFKEKKSFSKLTRDIVMELIDHIEIHESNKITIHFRFVRRICNFT